jgi:chromosome segregation ATPase
VATEWEVEVSSVRSQNQEIHTWLPEAQSQQSRAEERAREAEQRAKEAEQRAKKAEELKAALAAKVAALATAEEQLRLERAARQEAEERLQQERAALADARSGSSGSAPLSRGRRSRWRSGMLRSRGSMGS